MQWPKEKRTKDPMQIYIRCITSINFQRIWTSNRVDKK